MNSSNADRRFTIEQVVEACRSLPEPGFNRIMNEHPGHGRLPTAPELIRME